MICFLLLLPLVRGATFPQVDRPPRAALVAMAGEHEIGDILHSIRQLEESFNSRYLYHWVFFSAKPLSESFRRLTSNATNATCIYEHIPDVASAITLSLPIEDTMGEVFGPLKDPAKRTAKKHFKWHRRAKQWDWASIAKADRLRDYDWFWKIEPGVSS